jgi:signal transduction histidine kinase
VSILIADDHRDLREGLGELLRRRGHEVVLAANGVDALAELQRATPQLILLDLKMPRMNGLELAARLAGLPTLAHVPVYVLSELRGVDPRSLPANVVGTLEKPISAEALLAVVARHVPVIVAPDPRGKELLALCEALTHDLADPLRVLAGAGEHQDVARAAEERIRDLLHDVLGFARAAGAPFRLEPTDSSTLFERLRRKLSVRIEELGATLTHDPLPLVQADPLQLALLFEQLVDNALKFAGSAPAAVHVSAEREGARWRFSVRDNGIGIEPAYHERIFGLFERLHDAEAYPGHGLGLALCKRVVERHGGVMSVTSQLGAGATFTFTLA